MIIKNFIFNSLHSDQMIKKTIGALVRRFLIAAPRRQEAPPSMPWTRDAYISQPLPIRDELASLFKADDELVIFDIGACEGEDSIRYAQMFPKAKIFAFEPIPKNFELASAQLKKYRVENVELSPLALSDQAGSATFYVSSGAPENLSNTDEWDFGNKSSSLLPPDEVLIHYPWLKFENQIEVQTETLSAFATSRSIDHIDLIHMDVQGAELMVLKGAGDLLKKTKAVWMEIENVQLYKDQPLADEMQKFMEANGFVKMKDTVAHISGDHLYIRS